MSRDLSSLKTEFSTLFIATINACRARGVEMRTFYTLRDPVEQARLWRQSRTTAQVKMALESFNHHGAPFLAKCLKAAGPQQGRWATNAAPGFSWHQYGMAADAFLIERDGSAQWDARDPRYAVYEEEAKKQGLTSGRMWGDPVHVQMYKEEVNELHTMEQINSLMEEAFGYLLPSEPPR